MPASPRVARSSADAVSEVLSPEDLFSAVEDIGLLMTKAETVDALVSNVLARMLELFGCDRAWLLHPCDPNDSSWRVPIERTRPQWPGAMQAGTVVPMEDDARAIFSDALAHPGPRRYDPESSLVLEEVAREFSVQSQMVQAVRPKLGKPWLLGIHHCARPHVFNEQEMRMFGGIAQRMSDALTGLLSLRELRENRRRFRELSENTSDVLWTHEAGVGIRHLSPSFSRVTGRPIEVLLDSPNAWIRWIHPPDRAGVLAALRQRRSELTFRIRRSDGELRHLQCRWFPVRDELGRSVRTMGIALDVTEQRRTEQLQAHAQRLAAIGTVAAGLAHEINNPLTYVLHDLEQAIGLDPSTPARPMLERAREGALRVASIMGHLRAFSGPSADVRGPVDPLATLQAASSLARNVIRHRARLRFDLSPVSAVLATPKELAQAFLDLLLALAPSQWGDDDDEVIVSLRQDGAEVVVEIRGPGSATQTPLVDLATHRRIIDNCGGTIEIDDKAARLRLPAVEHTRAPQHPPEKRRKTRPLELLIVDDDDGVRGVLARILEEHQVHTVASGREALEWLASTTPDVVICDVMMPGLSGPQLFERVAQSFPTLVERFVFMTAGVFDFEELQALEATGRPQLQKPFSASELHALVAAVAAGASEHGRA